MDYSKRRRSRSRSNSKSMKYSRRSRSRKSSQSRSRSRSSSRISGRGSYSKSTKNKSRLSRSRSRSFSRQKISRSSRSRSTSRRRKIRSRSRSRSYRSRISRSRSRSISRSRHRKSRSRSKSRYKKSRSRSRSKSRSNKNRLSRSRSNSRSRKSRSKSVSKTKYSKSRSARSRSTSRKRKSKSSRSRSRSAHRKGLKEQSKKKSKLRSPMQSRRYDDKEMPSVIKKETDKRKSVSNIKESDNKWVDDDDDDDLQEIPVVPPTPPPVVDLASGSDDEEQNNEKHPGGQESSSNKEDMRIPLNFFDKISSLSKVPENISSLKFNETDSLRTLSKVDSSNDLIVPLTFGRKQPQTCVPSVQHQTVDLTANTDMRPSEMRRSNMRPSVYDMEDESVGETTIDLNLGKTSFSDSALREKNRGKLTTDSEFEGMIGPNSESSLLKTTANLTPLKDKLDNTEVALDRAPVRKNISLTEDINHIVKKRTTGQCAAAYLREGEILSTLRILHEMGREMGIWQDPISALYNQLSQLQSEGGDPQKYLNLNKDAFDTLDLIKKHLESVLDDSKLGAVQRVVREELLRLISGIIDGKKSHVPVECLTCYGIRIDVLACSMLHENPEEIKEFIHNTLIYEGVYEPTYENISTIYKKVENFQKRFHQGERNKGHQSKESFQHGESVTVEN